MTRILFITLAMLASISIVTPVTAAEPVYTGFFSNTAVGGYDPVAYFRQGQPVEGSKDFSTTYEGAQWHFSSQENLDAFLNSPAQYAPQYGGYCAWAAAEGKLAKGDPMYWKIVNGKLYLNYDQKVQETWETDIPGFIAKADANWPKLLD